MNRAADTATDAINDAPDVGGDADAHAIISLFFAAIGAGGRSFEELAARHGLNPAQARTVMFLAAPSPMRAVAEHLDRDPSYVTEIADGLESRGLLERRPASEDRRVKLLVLTDEGRRVRSALRDGFANTSPVMANLSTRERDQLRRLLTKLVGDASSA